MHIGFLTPEYPHPLSSTSGGLGTSIKNLATSLAAKNVQVSVFIYGQQKDIKFEENGIAFYFIRQKKYKFLGWYLYRKHLQFYLNECIKRKGIDLLEAPDWTGITAFIRITCPLVIRMNGSDAYFCYLEGRKQKWKNKFFEKRALLGADALISVSAFTAKITGELFKIKRPIQIIPNSINTDKFSPINIIREENKVFYFGTLIRKKGLLELALIFNQVVLKNPEAELILMGKDVVDIIEKKSTLELFQKKLLPQATERVKHFPEVSYSEIKEHIASATVIVLPSFAEALPMTWLEAMAMEKALVTSNIGWAKEVMINGVTGFTEDPKDHKAFANKILNLLRNPVLAMQMGKQARKQVELKFSTNLITLKNINFYKKIISC